MHQLFANDFAQHPTSTRICLSSRASHSRLLITTRSTPHRGPASSHERPRALIADFDNDIRRERQTDGIKKVRERGTRLVASLFWRLRSSNR